MPKIDLASVPVQTATGYAPQYRAEVAGRSYLRVGDAGGLSQFGVNIVILAPGAQSSMMHAHSGEDEFAVILSGECWLETQDGEWRMGPGDCAAFPAAGGELHHLVNRSDKETRFLVAGTRAAEDTIVYPEGVDMRFETRAGRTQLLHADGAPYGDSA